MNIEPMEVNRALEQGRALPYALARSLSRVTLGHAPQEVDPAQLLEIRFFNASEEIRVFRGPEGLQAVRTTAREGDVTLEERRALANPAFGRSVTVCRTLEFDEDGQAYVAGVRLTGWEGGKL